MFETFLMMLGFVCNNAWKVLILWHSSFKIFMDQSKLKYLKFNIFHAYITVYYKEKMSY